MFQNFDHLRNLSDSELAEINNEEMTEDGLHALEKERKRRNSPEYLKE